MLLVIPTKGFFRDLQNALYYLFYFLFFASVGFRPALRVVEPRTRCSEQVDIRVHGTCVIVIITTITTTAHYFHDYYYYYYENGR